MAENVSNDFTTTLNGAIANGSTTSITVLSGTGAPAASFRIRIENEILLVTDTGSGTNWTVTRGVEGTTGAAHADVTPVYHVITATGLQQWIDDRGFVVPSVPTGDPRTIVTGKQLIVFGSITIDDTLTIDGDLVIL